MANKAREYGSLGIEKLLVGLHLYAPSNLHKGFLVVVRVWVHALPGETGRFFILVSVLVPEGLGVELPL